MLVHVAAESNNELHGNLGCRTARAWCVFLVRSTHAVPRMAPAPAAPLFACLLQSKSLQPHILLLPPLAHE
jgi:hypothetical protein